MVLKLKVYLNSGIRGQEGQKTLQHCSNTSQVNYKLKQMLGKYLEEHN